MVHIGFIGAGKVGCTLGKYFITQQRIDTKIEFEILGYYSKSAESAKVAAKMTASTAYSNIEHIVLESDILFITVPDDVISVVWTEIKTLPIAGKMICHCSGALTSQEFDGAIESGAFGYSVHPLFAISNKADSWMSLSKSFFTIEGSDEKLLFLRNFIESFGNSVEVIKYNNKTKYHAAAVMASNQIIGLAKTAADLLTQCGFDHEMADRALGPLLSYNMQSLCQKGFASALTGPIERNDVRTITKHLACLDSGTRDIYSELSKVLIKIAESKYPDRDYSEMKKIFSVQQRIIGLVVKVTVERPIGSRHPQHNDICYTVNYGYISGIMAHDGEMQDAYILGIDYPISEFTGVVVAIVHRRDDTEDKWIVTPSNVSFTKSQIEDQIRFQEQYFDIDIICDDSNV